jgi:hypothetical protein
MLLTIRTTQRPATHLGFLLHKHQDHVHTREFPFGNATVFYPEATDEACTAAVLLDVDPVGMATGAATSSSSCCSSSDMPETATAPGCIPKEEGPSSSATSWIEDRGLWTP